MSEENFVTNPPSPSTMATTITDSTTTTTPVANKLKPHKAEQWEIEAIGKFLLDLHHNLIFGLRTNWMVPKNVLRSKFGEYLQRDKSDPTLRQRFLDANGTTDIGTLMRRGHYLIDTERGADHFHIRSASLFQYNNKLVEELDEKRKNGETSELLANGEGADGDGKTAINGDPALIDSLQVDDNAQTHELIYEGSQQQTRNADFQLTSMGCYICQMNFASPNNFEDHVEQHSDESDFYLLKDYDKSAAPIFTLSYNVCKNSHYFRFNLTAARNNITIEKLVIVQTRTFYYVHNTRVPYALDKECKDHFFVDSHLFRKGVVQPIVLVFHEQSNKQKRYVEQHHFCRIEEFPVVKLSINPCRLSNKLKFKEIFKLPQYMPTLEIRRALQTDEIEAPLCEMSNEFREYLNNNKTLTQQNIRAALQCLLQVEDWDTIREYSSLVQRNVKLRKYENEYIVKLKTTKHIRYESIIYPYDDVIVLPTEDNTIIPTTNFDDMVTKIDQLVNEKRKSYYGQIKSISYGRVAFACDRKIPDEKTYTVLFRPSRMVMRYQYRALEQLVAMPGKVLKKFLFPAEVLWQELPTLSMDLHNKNIYTNPEQHQAIKCIVNNSVEKMAPYILFGPPGTGKTTTLVEAILQIFTLQPQARILITAGSNGACDEIALRLCKILAPLNETNTIARIYSRSFENRSENINELLLEYSNLYADHFLPDINVLHNYRIVVCTLSIIGRLSTGKFGKENDGSGVFTHVFVDEVAASTETETLVGIMATLTSDASLVIAGDHRQLGPILNSQRAADLGLELSLMERLLKRDCYRVDENDKYNEQIQTRLLRNYRSHPEIVRLYSGMYYDGRLKPMAKAADVENFCRNWHRAPNPQYPIIFHSIFGPEEREQNSASRYNPLEIRTVLDYVRDLLFFGIKGQKIVQSDIGIITPYKKQYMRIQEELNLRNWYQIECGAVESFQGKEKNIIIVSFVRSFTNSIGFLESARRLNVTLSRARSLLILIGNPRTLSVNADFKYIIEQCQLHNTLVGAVYRDGEIAAPATKKKDNNKNGNDNKSGNDNKNGNANKNGNDNKNGNANKNGNDNKNGNANKNGNDNKNSSESTCKLTKSMEKLNLNQQDTAQGSENGDDKPKRANNQNRTRRRRYGKTVKPGGGNNGGGVGGSGGHAKENATKVDDALKSKNSSTFKSAKTPSVGKQRQTFETYKNLCQRDIAAATAAAAAIAASSASASTNTNMNLNVNNLAAKKSNKDINDLLCSLPRVPNKVVLQKKQTKEELIEIEQQLRQLRQQQAQQLEKARQHQQQACQLRQQQEKARQQQQQAWQLRQREAQPHEKARPKPQRVWQQQPQQAWQQQQPNKVWQQQQPNQIWQQQQPNQVWQQQPQQTWQQQQPQQAWQQQPNQIWQQQQPNQIWQQQQQQQTWHQQQQAWQLRQQQAQQQQQLHQQRQQKPLYVNERHFEMQSAQRPSSLSSSTSTTSSLRPSSSSNSTAPVAAAVALGDKLERKPINEQKSTTKATSTTPSTAITTSTTTTTTTPSVYQSLYERAAVIGRTEEPSRPTYVATTSVKPNTIGQPENARTATPTKIGRDRTQMANPEKKSKSNCIIA